MLAYTHKRLEIPSTIKVEVGVSYDMNYLLVIKMTDETETGK